MIAQAASSRRLGDLPWHAAPRRRSTAPWSALPTTKATSRLAPIPATRERSGGPRRSPAFADESSHVRDARARLRGPGDASQVTPSPVDAGPFTATIELVRFAQVLIDSCRLDPRDDEFKRRFAIHLRRCCPRADTRQLAQWIVYVRRIRPPDAQRPLD